MAEASSSSKVTPSNRDPGSPGVIRSLTTPVLAPSEGSRTASPDVEKPGTLRTSQTFPVATSHGSPSQLGTRRPSRVLTNGPGNPFTRSSSSQFLAEGAEAIDPLSQHILKRTNTEKTFPLRLRQTSHEAEAGGNDAASSLSPTDQAPVRGEVTSSLKSSKDKKKGVSFLSRFIPTIKKDQISDSNDDQSDLDDERMDTEVFAQPVGFIPRFPPPPKYIRVRAHNKKQKTFDRVFVAQELKGFDTPSGSDKSVNSATTSGANRGVKAERAIWALEFSKDGKYMAAAGQDRKIRVWAVIANSEDRREHEHEEEEEDGDGDGPSLRLTAPVFKSKPIQEYEGHTSSVLDLCWSKNNFLLSSSMDKTVRLWHVSRSECLCCFKHSDFVTSIQFHPRDDRFFLAGSLDCKLRLWSIPDKSVAFWATVPEMITAVAFTPDGKCSIAGCLNGLCLFYETDGLKANGQIHVRSARGRNSKGSKITGIDTIIQPPNDPNGEVKLLITSNDSRIRLYNFRDRNLEAKFRGNENSTSQIRASFSDDGKHVICGSEDRRAYIWPTGWNDKESDKDKRAFEMFETQSSMVTVATMAPTKTKQLLGLSGDPIYDLCNPPPVTLGPQNDSRISHTSKTDSGALRRDGVAPGSGKAESINAAKAFESPAYLSRSTHPTGNIIITADYTGRIKVFRQDCAYQRRSELWETNSTFSRKILGRTNSARHSIASSIGKESKSPSERIISWRDSVVGTEISSIENPRSSGSQRTRSTSPRKSIGLSRYSSPNAPVPESPSASTHTPPPSVPKSSMDSPASSTMAASRRSFHTAETEQTPASPQRVELPREDPSILMDATQSHAFWSKTVNAAQAASARRAVEPLDPHFLTPVGRQFSATSALSSDCSSLTGDEGEVLRCTNCKGTNFRATKTKEGKSRLICGKCGKPYS